MTFTETKLPGAFVIDPEKIEDERGFFARAWCEDEFAAQGLRPGFVQANVGFSKQKGTLRGLHYQTAPHQESKLVRCTGAAVFDVMVDLRPSSPTYRQWVGIELSQENHRMLYIPEGFAHGYQTLRDQTEVFYLVSSFYAPDAEAGIRYDDPAFGIEWPIAVEVISEKDQRWADYDG